jgi:sodium transport system permease protein
MYPVSEETLQAIKPIVQFIRNQPLVYVVLLIGLIPAICEEVAFRGFILSGLRNIGNKWAAIVISSLFFGLTHGMIQQSLAAAMVGAVIGYIAVQTNSLLPGMVFHFTHNSFSAIASRVTPELIERYPLLHWILKPTGSDTLTHTYHLAWVVMSGVLGFALLLYFRRLGRAPCPSERPGEPCPPGSELA